MELRQRPRSEKMWFGERRSWNLGSGQSRMLSRNGCRVPTTKSGPSEPHPAWRETGHKEEIDQINNGADVWHNGGDLLADHKMRKSGDTDSPANPVRIHLRTWIYLQDFPVLCTILTGNQQETTTTHN